MKLFKILVFSFFMIGIAAPMLATQPVDMRNYTSTENTIEAEHYLDYEHDSNFRTKKQTKLTHRISTFFQKAVAKIFPTEFQKTKTKSTGDGSTAALIGLIMGAISIIGIFVPFLRLVGIIMAPTSIIFSIIGLRRLKRSQVKGKKWQAIVGLILGGLATITLITFLGFLLFL